MSYNNFFATASAVDCLDIAAWSAARDFRRDSGRDDYVGSSFEPCSEDFDDVVAADDLDEDW